VFRRNKAAILGLGLLGFVILAMLLGPSVYPVPPFDIVARPFTPPFEDASVMLGSDYLGRDILAGMVVVGTVLSRMVRTEDDFFMGGRRYGKVLMTFFSFASATSSEEAVSVTAGTWRAGLAGIWWAFLWLWATPVVSGALAGWVEAQAGPRELAAVQPAPVIVVLGGAVGGARPPLRPEPDLGSAADRVWHAARLYHAGKAPRILLSGGSIKPGIQGEAHAMRRFLLDLGVPDAAIWLEAASTDTAGNAVLSAALLRASGVDEAILVTSALHMRRARAQFMQTGLTIHPAPTDFEVVDEPLDL
jgi:uncharacterized SAM-binding protein YcdF (DUF218 family)